MFYFITKVGILFEIRLKWFYIAWLNIHCTVYILNDDFALKALPVRRNELF